MGGCTHSTSWYWQPDFHADSFMRPMEIVGRNDTTLEQAWDPRPEAYLSVPSGFSEFLHAQRPQRTGRQLLAHRGCRAAVQLHPAAHRAHPSRSVPQICATRHALARFEQEREQASQHTIWVTGCKSWYLDDRGIPAGWPWSFICFRQQMNAVDLSAFECV